jgi:hypothetical protein
VAERALGVRLEKRPAEKWPTAFWAVVANAPREVVDCGTAQGPKSYDEATALRHLHEAIATAVREHKVTATLVWEIEPKARLNQKLRPRLRAEGVACAAAAAAGSLAELVAWSEIASRACADRPKAEYEQARRVCGVDVGEADSFAVLVAVAALRA